VGELLLKKGMNVLFGWRGDGEMVDTLVRHDT
jgi:hypothetical protein